VPPAVAKNSPNPSSLLAEADRFYSLFNWPAAHPLYERAEKNFEQLGDRRNAAYARIGRLRSEFGARSYEDVARDLERELRTPVVDNDPRLKLWAYAAKGYTDIEINAPTAKQDWEQVLTLARQMSDKKWINRAQGELGIITFLEGDWKRGAWLVGKAYFETSSAGDIGSQIRYLQFIGAGLNEVNRQSEALHLFDRAMELARDTPGAGFPYMAYEVKAQALTTLGRGEQAEGLLEKTLAQGRAAHRLDTEAQVQTQLGEVELKLGDQRNGVRDLEAAGMLAQRYGFHRISAEAMFDLYGAYRRAGDLSRAEQCVRDGLAASAQIGDRYYLPRDLNALAELEALQGRPREAETSYRRAEAIVDGMLRRAPGRYAEASLLSAVAEIYAGHFRVAAALGDTDEAYRVLERIRGRSTVDMLLRQPTAGSVGCQDSEYEEKIAAVQLHLMQTVDRDRRAALLNDLLEAEVERDYHCELDYGAGNLRTETASLEQLRHVLRPDELLVEYVLNNNASFCLRVTRESAGIVTLPTNSNALDNLVKAYLANVELGRSAETEARELYRLLLQPALGSAQKRGTRGGGPKLMRNWASILP